jgi:hypothetical protein
MDKNKLKKVSEYSIEKLKENSNLLQRGLKDLGVTPNNQADSKNIWERFEGKANTKEVLTEKAKDLAQLICVCTFKDVEIIFNQLEKNERLEIKSDLEVPVTFRKLFQEFILFYMHYTDRLAFGYLGVEERDIFIDNLIVEVRSLLTSALSHSFENLDQEMKFFSDFGDVYNDRQREYGNYKKIYAEKDEPLGKTLLWEFEKKIAEIIESEIGVNEFKMIIMLYIHSVSLNSLVLMQLNNLFKT